MADEKTKHPHPFEQFFRAFGVDWNGDKGTVKLHHKKQPGRVALEVQVGKMICFSLMTFCPMTKSGEHAEGPWPVVMATQPLVPMPWPYMLGASMLGVEADFAEPFPRAFAMDWQQLAAEAGKNRVFKQHRWMGALFKQVVHPPAPELRTYTAGEMVFTPRRKSAA